MLRHIPRGVLMVYRAAPGWTATWMGLLLVQGLLPAATVLVMREAVEQIATALPNISSTDVLLPAIGPALLLGILLLLSESLEAVTKWVRSSQAELAKDYLASLIHKQAAKLDLAYYEETVHYDRLHRARIDAISQPLSLLQNLGMAVQNGITLVSLAAVLATYAWWLPLALIGGALPTLWAAGIATLRLHKWRMHNTANERRASYFDMVLTHHKNAAEVRLFSLADHFSKNYQTLRAKLRAGRMALGKQAMKAEQTAGTISLAVMFASMFWLLRRGTTHGTGMGDVVLFYQIFNKGQSGMRSLFNSFGEIYRNLLFLDNLFEFLDLVTHTKDPDIPHAAYPSLNESIDFENVTFLYPGGHHAALEGFTAKIPAGKIAAIVGENGAGKSTLIKLICRFYDPSQGRVTMDGVDLKSFTAESIREQITVLFQEPVHYHETAADNIALGDLKANPTAQQIESAAIAAGADKPIAKLPDGYNNLLGRWFGGDELSVGEWQRIALARAFLRKSQLMLLDEPTSAMDSWAEVDWMTRFRKLAEGKTAVVITHRFTTAMKADIIFVMDNGKVIEAGSHAELLERGGKYATSWIQQVGETNDSNVFNKA